jgi:23S rRNA A2030 N6-methylase RlmJ
MKLILPNGEQRYLDESLPYSDRVKIVQEITDEWEDHFRKNWERHKTKICLDVLSTYLCVVKEEEDKHKEDKYILSATKVKRMIRGDKKVTNFSSLSDDDMLLLGLHDNRHLVSTWKDYTSKWV